jgi:hypothetical protein
MVSDDGTRDLFYFASYVHFNQILKCMYPARYTRLERLDQKQYKYYLPPVGTCERKSQGYLRDAVSNCISAKL